MLKGSFKNRPIGFYLSLAASVLGLVLAVFYAVYTGMYELFNAGLFVFYIIVFLLPLVYFFVDSCALTRMAPILQTVFLVLVICIMFATVGDSFASSAEGEVSGGVMVTLVVLTGVAALASLASSVMPQTKKLTAEQSAEAEASRAAAIAFTSKHKAPVITAAVAFLAVAVAFCVLAAYAFPAILTVHVESVGFGAESVEMFETETYKLNAVVSPDNAENKYVKYSSADENIATVSESGVVKAVAAGKTTVTVTTADGEYTAKCEIVVKELKVDTMTYSGDIGALHYKKGETFDPSGITVTATLTNGEVEELDDKDLEFTADEKYVNEDGDITINDTKVPVTAVYEYRGKPAETTLDVYGDVAEVADESAFSAAYAKKDEVGYIRFTNDIAFSDVQAFDRDIIIDGVMSVPGITLNEDAAVTVIGRVNDIGVSDGDFALSGEGSLDVQTVYGENDGIQSAMEEKIAGLYTVSGLSVGGAVLTTTGIHVDNGDLTISGGANVTVSGPDVVTGSTGESEKYNGVDVYNGGVTVSGDGTKFRVLADHASYNTRAGIECGGDILVDDKAEFVVDKTENAAFHYGYSIYSGSNISLTVSGGATAKFNMLYVDAARTDIEALSGITRINVLGASTFSLEAISYFGRLGSDLIVDFEVAPEANVLINGVKLDMTGDEPVWFGHMDVTSVSVSANGQYTAGDKFTAEDVTAVAVFGTELRREQVRVAVDPSSISVPADATLAIGENRIKVTVLGKEYELVVTAQADQSAVANASSLEEFTAALGNKEIEQININGDVDLGETLTIGRSILVYGDINVDTLTVSENVTLTMADGRIVSDGALTINGGGTITIKYDTADVYGREDFAAVYAGGDIKISAVTLECVGIAANGNVTVDGGAKVTVYGKNFSTIASDGKACGVNGIHISDTAKSSILTVSGTGTELSILYDSDRLPVDGNNNSMTPAAVNVSVKVDGAKFTIGSTEGSISWGYAVWFDYLDYQQTIEATNGAQVTFNADGASADPTWGKIVCSNDISRVSIKVSGDGTSFTVNTDSANSFDESKVTKEGNATVTVNYPGSAG